jgi:serine/threonine protein kinase
MEIPGYIIKNEIGKGGMATVYLATQESLTRSVCLKILDNVDADESKDLIERFMAEGRIIASLSHPNIITIYDIGVANNMFYISMVSTILPTNMLFWQNRPWLKMNWRKPLVMLI